MQKASPSSRTASDVFCSHDQNSIPDLCRRHLCVSSVRHRRRPIGGADAGGVRRRPVRRGGRARRGAKTSESYALAAQSLAIQGHFFAKGEDKKALFQRAVELAEEAVRLDPANPEAHIQLAHTTGRYGQAIGFLQAVTGGYATRVRESVEEALRLDPDKAAGHLSMATWHAEIVNAAGGMAGFLYGATEKKARAHYGRTLELMPDAKVVCVEYAFGLLLMDEERNREEARGLLERALKKPSRDAVDRLYHEQAMARLAALKGG